MNLERPCLSVAVMLLAALAASPIDGYAQSSGDQQPLGGLSRTAWGQTGPNDASRIRSIVIDPSPSGIMVAGSVWGGLWRRVGAGAWTPVNDFLPTLAIGALVAQPGNFDVLYAGTGEGFY